MSLLYMFAHANIIPRTTPQQSCDEFFRLNFALFIKVIPVIFLMILISGILIYFFKRSKKLSSIDIKSDSKNDDLFHFYPAIKFAILFVVIKFLSSLA